MKKLLLLALIVLGGVNVAYATRVYAKINWSYGTNVNLYLYDSSSYGYGGNWGSCAMTSIGNNWYYIDTWKPFDSNVKTIVFNGNNDSERISLESEYVDIKGKYLNVDGGTATWEDITYVAYSPNHEKILSNMTTLDGVNYTVDIDNQTSNVDDLEVLVAPKFLIDEWDALSALGDGRWTHFFRPWDSWNKSNKTFAFEGEVTATAGIFGGSNSLYLPNALHYNVSLSIATDHDANNASFKVSSYFTRTVSSLGYATFSSTYDVDVTGATATYITGVGANNVLTEASFTNGIKANTGALLYKAGGGDVTFTPAASTPTDVSSTNKLVAVSSDIAELDQTSGDNTNYILTNQTVNGQKAIGFYKANSGTGENKKNSVAAGKAYLSLPSAIAVSRAFFWLGGETSTINSAETAIQNVEGYYNLNGQRIAQPTKGLYIVNGKKVILK